jgi:uncharacterized protein YdeI (YjbR/CyaY-like superfamily)
LKSFKSVEDYIQNSGDWKNHLIELRQSIASTGLEEVIKWGAPVYASNNKNIVGIGAFKNFISMWFYNGVFLNDNANKLINAQEGTTKALRQWRFTYISEISKNNKLIKQYIFEAIEVEKQGKSIKPETNKKLILPTEFKTELRSNLKFNEAFQSFSIPKQREFAEFIGEAKREQTRQSRLEKTIVMTLKGEGLNDKHKK